jgi:hypothetical protein
LWNPPDVFFDRLQHAVRTSDPYLVSTVAKMVEEHGVAEVVALLNPEQFQRRR